MEILYELFANIIDAVIAFVFIRKFLDAKRSVYLYIGILAHFLCTTYLTSVITFNYATSIVNLLIMILYALTVKGTSFWKKILAPVIFEASLIVVNSTFLYMTSLIMRRSIIEVLSVGATIRYLCMFSSKICLLGVAFIILRVTIQKKRKYTFADFFVFLISPLASTVILFAFMKLGIIYQITDNVSVIMCALFSVVALVVFSYIVYMRVTDNAYEIYNLRLKRNEIEYEEKLYKEMNDNYEKISRIKHDINSQLGRISQLIDVGDSVAATENVKALNDRLNSINNIVKTNNSTVDFILNSKLSERKDIESVFTLTEIKLDFVDNIDLIAILSNLVDNAIEAVDKCENKSISIEMFTMGNNQNIVVKNSISKSVLTNNPNLETTKSNKNSHGFGTRIIKETVAKYNGLYSVSEDNNSFITHILIPIK